MTPTDLKQKILSLRKYEFRGDMAGVAYNRGLAEAAELAAQALAEVVEENRALREAAQTVIDRWDSPQWVNTEPTSAVIGRLRAALAKDQA